MAATDRKSERAGERFQLQKYAKYTVKRGKQNDEKCKTSIYNDVVVDNGFATLATRCECSGMGIEVRLTNLNQLTDYNARIRCECGCVFVFVRAV